jgi:chromosome segregation ATPase
LTSSEPVAELPVEVAEEFAAVTKSLTERLSSMAIEINDKAVKAAERRVQEVVRSAGEQREQAERELADASQTVDGLESKLDEARAQTETLERKLAENQATIQAQAVEIAQLRERLNSTEAERGRYQAEAERLSLDHEDLAKLRGQVEAMQVHAANLMDALAKRQA